MSPAWMGCRPQLYACHSVMLSHLQSLQSVTKALRLFLITPLTSPTAPFTYRAGAQALTALTQQQRAGKATVLPAQQRWHLHQGERENKHTSWDRCPFLRGRRHQRCPPTESQNQRR